MPRRTFWMVTGMAMGAGTTLWAERKVRRTIRQAATRLAPDAVVTEIGRSARSAAGSVEGRLREAVTTGRDEMERREEELWASLAAQGVRSVLATQGPQSGEPLSGGSPTGGPRPVTAGSGALATSRRSRTKLPSHLGN